MQNSDLPEIFPLEEEGDLVICRFIRHHITKKIIYPKNSRFFAFRSKRRKKQPHPEQMALPLMESEQKQQ